MRAVAIVFSFVFVLVMLSHTHCLAEICPGNDRLASMGISNAPADDPLCETETVCPANDDFRRADSLTAPAVNDNGMVVLPAASVLSTDERIAGSRNIGLIARSHQPPILTLNQIFRV